MPVNLSIKNVPDALADKLRANALRNHRSLQKELLSVLERAAGLHDVSFAGARATPQGRLSIEEVARRARERFPDGTPSSVQFIREQRDSRYGDSYVSNQSDEEAS
ncbi:MAG TPA: hypothetical protein VIT02_15110 [Burkholderiaceae bacterium]